MTPNGVRSRFSARACLRCVPALALALAVLHPGVATAHALLVRSSPTQGAVLASAPREIRLWFSEDVNGLASRIIVWDRYRHVENDGNAELVPGQTRELQVRLKHLSGGSYLVLWTSVSAADGHVLHGYFSFSFGMGGPVTSMAAMATGSLASSFTDSSTPISVLAHWIELLASASWLGSAACSALLIPAAARRLDAASLARERARLCKVLQCSLTALLLSSSIVLVLMVYAAAGNAWSSLLSWPAWRNILSAQFGQLWLGRQSLVLVAMLTTVALRIPRPALSPSLAAMPYTGESPWTNSNLPSAVLGALYLFILAASGHAPSLDLGHLNGSHIVSASVVIDWLHLIGVALWFGGQIYIVLVLIPALRLLNAPRATIRAFLEMLNRFSPIAYGSIALFTISGAFVGTARIPSWHVFFNSVYGRALIVKLALIGLMMLTSCLTVYILRPGIRRTLSAPPHGASMDELRARTGRLLVWLRVNPVLGIGVLLATSIMFYFPPPVASASPPVSRYTVRIQGATAAVSISPLRSGQNQITVLLRDRHSRPISLAHLVLMTTMLDMRTGTRVASMVESAPGRFTGAADLPMAGHWRLRFLIYRPSPMLAEMQIHVSLPT